MNIENCITSKNKYLYEEVKSRFSIDFIKRTCDNFWFVEICGNKVTIEYGDEKNKEECLVHELLHVKLCLLGYRKIKWAQSNIRPNSSFEILLSAIDNIFQHHKIFPIFLQMGYSPDKFVGNSEDELKNDIFDFLKNPTQDICIAMTKYLTLTSPNAEFIFEDIDNLKEQFRRISDGSYSILFDVMDQEIQNWKNGNDLEICRPIKNIFSIIPESQCTYFSYTKDRNRTDGFFISPEC